MSDVTETIGDLDASRERSERLARRGRSARRVAVVTLLVFVGLGLSGRLGYRQSSIERGSDRIDAELSYPSVTRGGLPTHWSLAITAGDGAPIGGTVRIETTAAYFDGLDHNDLVPAPDRAWQTPEAVVWEFDAADESALMVTLDVRTQPDHRWRSSATTVVFSDDVEIASFDYRTWTLP